MMTMTALSDFAADFVKTGHGDFVVKFQVGEKIFDFSDRFTATLEYIDPKLGLTNQFISMSTLTCRI